MRARLTFDLYRDDLWRHLAGLCRSGIAGAHAHGDGGVARGGRQKARGTARARRRGSAGRLGSGSSSRAVGPPCACAVVLWTGGCALVGGARCRGCLGGAVEGLRRRRRQRRPAKQQRTLAHDNNVTDKHCRIQPTARRNKQNQYTCVHAGAQKSMHHKNVREVPANLMRSMTLPLQYTLVQAFQRCQSIEANLRHHEVRLL